MSFLALILFDMTIKYDTQTASKIFEKVKLLFELANETQAIATSKMAKHFEICYTL